MRTPIIYPIQFIKILFILISGIIYGFVLNNNVSKHEYQIPNNREFVEISESQHNTDIINDLKKELVLANSKIEQLESKMQGFEDRIKKPYPNVKYLNYRSKKRILV